MSERLERSARTVARSAIRDARREIGYANLAASALLGTRSPEARALSACVRALRKADIALRGEAVVDADDLRPAGEREAS